MEMRNPIYFGCPTTTNAFELIHDLELKEDSYYNFQSRKVPRLTNIISAVYGDPGSLMKWAAQFGSTASFVNEQKKILATGTIAHHKIESFLQRKDDDSIFDNSKATNAFCNFVQWYNDKQSLKIQMENLAIEQKTSNPWFGGTMDWYVKFKSPYTEANFIVDFKTSNRIEQKHLIQAYGYYWSLKWNIFNGYSDLPIPDGIGIIRVDKYKKIYNEFFLDFRDPSTYSIYKDLDTSLGSMINWFYGMSQMKNGMVKYQKSNIERWMF